MDVTVTETRHADLIALPEPAMRYARASKAHGTQRVYREAFAAFRAWCTPRGLAALPAAANTVASWLAAEADRGIKPATIGTRLAAIRSAHMLAEFPSPTNSERVKVVVQGIRRHLKVAPRQKAAATAEHIHVLLSYIPADTLKGKRDRAVILLAFAAALRRSELVALNADDLADSGSGLDVRVRSGKTDQEGEGAVIPVPHGNSLLPVAAVRTWMEAAGIVAGPVFLRIGKGDRLTSDRLTAESVALIVKGHAKKAGLDPFDFAGHSLRAGFMTSAAERGVDLERIMHQSRHKTPRVAAGYIRHANRYRNHPGESFL